jgi:hypothetical protein
VRIELQLELKRLGEVFDRTDVSKRISQTFFQEPPEGFPLDGNQLRKFERFVKVAE